MENKETWWPIFNFYACKKWKIKFRSIAGGSSVHPAAG